MGIDKFISSHSELILMVAILEAIIIAFLVSYIFYMIWDEREGKSNNDDVINKELRRWKDQCQKQNIELTQLKREKESWKGRQSTKTSHSKDDNRTNNFGYSFGQGDKNLPKKESNGCIDNDNKSYISETLNEDGNETTSIYFDLTSDIPTAETAPITRKYEYLEPANNGQFRKLLPSDEKSFFRTWVEDGVRMFEFHGNVERALANINAIFDDVCEIEGKQNGATQIYNITPGTLTSKLEVDKPAKIRLS